MRSNTLARGLAAGLLALVLAPAANAATSEFKVLLDLDDQPGTGCTVSTVSGNFTGVEEILVTTVDTSTTPPMVTGVAKQACTVPASNTFGAPVPIASPFAPPWAVGIGNGTGGSGTVETYLPSAGLTFGQTIRLGFISDIVGGGGDAMLTTDGTRTGAPILFQAAATPEVPMLGAAGLALLAVLLAGGALLLLRRRGANRGVIAALLLLSLGLGAASAAIVPDGVITDWAGVNPIATDVSGDAPIDADLVAGFAKREGNNFFFRFDALFAATPHAVNDTYDAAMDTPLTVPAPGVLANDTGGGLMATVQTAAPTTQGGSVTLAADGSFTYTPAAGFSGDDTFNYTITNPKGTSSATVTIHVNARPMVTATTPANGATGVSLTNPITITFNEPVHATTGAFTLQCPTGTPETFTVSPTLPGNATTFTLQPTAPLPASTACTVTVVASHVTDVAHGNLMEANYAFTFTSDTPPSVTATTPANGATGVDPAADLTVTFSQPVSASASSFTLACPTGTPEAFTVPTASPATTFTLHPTSPLPTPVTCTVTVLAAQVADAAGTHPTANFAWSFTTAPAPTVTSTTPANGAVNVSPSATVTVNFSESVNVTGTAFKLECPSGTPVAFTVAPASPAASFVLTPSAPLPTGVTCTATVVASQVTSVSTNQHLGADDVVSFTIDTPPTVTSTVPANGASGVDPATTVTVTFSKQVSVTGTAFGLNCGSPVAFTVTPASPATAFTLHPTSPLPAGATCTLTVTATQVTDTSAGQQMAADFSASFSVHTAPSVTSVTPANGATNVPLNSTVTIAFSESVSVTGTAFKLECPSGTPVAFTVTPASPATTYTLHPTANLPGGTACTVTVVAAQVSNSLAQHPAADFTATFNTDVPPTVTSTSPTNGAPAVPIASTVTINFSESVNVTGTAFKLECPSGTPVAFTVTPASPATSFTLHPTSPLPAPTTCTVTVVASQVTNTTAASHLAADFVFSFTTNAPPTVTSTVPANGTANVLPTSTVTVNFSESVNAAAGAFTLNCGSAVPFTVSPASPAASYVLTPTSPLPAGATCTLTVVAANVTDVDAGQHLTPGDYTASFTVDVPPMVTAVVPANGATAVDPTTTVTVDFSKAVNVSGSSFTLECPTGTPIAFTITPASPATSFVLHPTASLPGGAVCTLTVVASQVADTTAGQTMAANFTSSFTVDTPPAVTSVTPANGAINVPLNSTVTIDFNKQVNVNASSFKLECPSGTPVAFTVTPASPASAFTLTPTASLPGGTACTVTVVAAQVTDTTFNQHPAADFTSTFTTDTPPTVTSTVPANGATGIDPAQNITVNFSKPVTATASAFTLECPTGTPIPFTVPTSSPASSFNIHPTSPLPAPATCTVTVVASQISDAIGTTMTADSMWSFTTDAPPTVTSTTPATGATAVLPTATVTFNFSKAVNVTGTAFKLECPSGTPVAFTVTPASPASSFVLHPTANLPAGVTCTATAVASQITSVSSGQHLSPGDVAITFTINTLPTVTSTVPASGATNVDPNTTVTVNFSEPVNVTGTAFKLECPTGTPVAFTVTPASPASSFVLHPTAKLPGGVTCTATVVAAQVTDVDAGQHMAADFTASFSVHPLPSVTTVVPANGAIDVALNATVTVTFSESVSVTGSAFSLQCPTGTPVTFTVSPASPATSFTLTPTANLPGGAVCTLTVVANQVTNSFGQNMAANFTSTFTVDTPPTVTSTTPANGAGGVAVTATVTINFSKSVTVTGSAFTLQCPTGTPVTFTVTPASPAASYVLHPTANLPAGVTCTGTVVANQVTDAVGTQMAANYVFTFNVPPVAVADTYPENVIGHVSVNSSLITYSVTSNDISAAPFTITAFDATTAHGGTVTMTTSGAGIGQFTYNPPVGFTGTDTFTYTISNAAGSGTATVSMPIVGLIWFINNTASAGDGRLSSPFNSLAAFQAINDGAAGHGAANHNIFLYQSGTDYTGPVTLLAGQRLIGQDATATLAAITGLTPGASSAALPGMNSGDATIVRITSSGNTVTLGTNNTVRGLTLGNSTGTALTGTSFGTLTVRDASILTSGSAISLNTGVLDAILTKVSSAGGTHGIALTATTGGLQVTGDGASDPANTTRGRTTAKSGGGTLTLGSGGTITGATSAGVLLSNAANVTLRNMTITANGSGINTGGDGITASAGTSALMLDNDQITNHAGNFGLHGTTISGLVVQHTEISANATAAGTEGPDVWDVRFDDLTGTSSIANSLFFNSRENIVGMNEGTINASAALNLTITNSEFRDTTVGSPGNDGLFVNATGSASVSLSVSGSTFLRDDSNAFQYNGNSSSGGGTISVTNCTFDQNGTAINIAHQGLGKTLTFDVNGNALNQTVGGRNTAISIFLGGSSSATTLLQGKVRNNTVGNNTVAKSGSNFGKGIDLFASGAGTLTAAVTSNTAVQIFEDTAFRAISSTHTGTINVTVTGNDFESQPSGMGLDGIDLIAGAVPADTGTLCVNMSGNVKALGDASAGGSGIFAATEAGTPTINLQGYGGAANNTTQINAFLNGTATTVSPATVSFVGAGTIKAAPSACPTPP